MSPVHLLGSVSGRPLCEQRAPACFTPRDDPEARRMYASITCPKCRKLVEPPEREIKAGDPFDDPHMPPIDNMPEDGG